jgi:hypothetical protein
MQSVSCYGLSEKRLCRVHTPIGAEQVIDGLSVPVDRSVEIVPVSADRYCGLIHAPGRVDGPCVSRPSTLVLRNASQNPSQDGRV